jgi:hypothetical protein
VRISWRRASYSAFLKDGVAVVADGLPRSPSNAIVQLPPLALP